jgi:hypothetical protein
MKDIVIKGKYIIHGIYLLIILILIILLFAEIYNIRICVNPQQTSQNSQITTSPKIVDVSATSRTVQTNRPATTSTAAQTASRTATNTSSQTNSSNQSPQIQETAEPGKIKFTIEDVKYEIKGDDWATLTNIKCKIENGNEDFYPVIQIFLYDDNDPEDIKSLEQALIDLPLVENGEIVVKEIPVHISHNELNKEKTLKILLRNEYGQLLKTAIKKYDVK